MQCTYNSIYGIKNVSNDTTAANRKYVKGYLKQKLDKNKDINMAGFKILSYRKPNDLNELLNKSYVDQKVQAGGSIDLTPYLKKDGSVVMTNNVNLNNNKLINVKNATANSDAVNFQQLKNSVSTVTNVSEILY